MSPVLKRKCKVEHWSKPWSPMPGQAKGVDPKPLADGRCSWTNQSLVFRSRTASQSKHRARRGASTGGPSWGGTVSDRCVRPSNQPTRHIVRHTGSFILPDIDRLSGQKRRPADTDTDRPKQESGRDRSRFSPARG